MRSKLVWILLALTMTTQVLADTSERPSRIKNKNLKAKAKVTRFLKSKWTTYSATLTSAFALGMMVMSSSCTTKIRTLEDEIAKMVKPSSGVLCNSFEPILWAEEDTEETKQQIVSYNAAWDSICRKED